MIIEKDSLIQASISTRFNCPGLKKQVPVPAGAAYTITMPGRILGLPASVHCRCLHGIALPYFPATVRWTHSPSRHPGHPDPLQGSKEGTKSTPSLIHRTIEFFLLHQYVFMHQGNGVKKKKGW